MLKKNQGLQKIYKLDKRTKAYVVMRTESATFPLDIYVATFDAWPPGQHETKIKPVASGADNFKACGHTKKKSFFTSVTQQNV